MNLYKLRNQSLKLCVYLRKNGQIHLKYRQNEKLEHLKVKNVFLSGIEAQNGLFHLNGIGKLIYKQLRNSTIVNNHN